MQLRQIVKLLVHGLLDMNLLRAQRALVVVGKGLSRERLQDVCDRIEYYAPGWSANPRVVERLHAADYLSPNPILLVDNEAGRRPWHHRLRGGVFDVDSVYNRWDGWAWARLTEYVACMPVDPTESRQRMEVWLDAREPNGFERAYLFGTGPSLARAETLDCGDGYRVVCNTIVRDPGLWRTLDPHFIVAGDAIYHFGHTEFARAFRRDLAKRLEDGRTMFVYPDFFHAVVSREFPTLAPLLVPVPVGRGRDVHRCLRERFELASMGNVLNALLLPLGCFLAREVLLWGFDGRAPNDQLFWSNSNRHTYSELMPSLRQAHPAFFEQSVPKEDPNKYVREVHGDVLDQCLSEAERDGWCFVMLHKSYTESLQRHHVPGVARFKDSLIEAAD